MPDTALYLLYGDRVMGAEQTHPARTALDNTVPGLRRALRDNFVRFMGRPREAHGFWPAGQAPDASQFRCLLVTPGTHWEVHAGVPVRVAGAHEDHTAEFLAECRAHPPAAFHLPPGPPPNG